MAGYYEAVLPANEKLLWKGMTAYTDAVPGMPPKITDDMISSPRDSWCTAPPSGCEPYPACT